MNTLLTDQTTRLAFTLILITGILSVIIAWLTSRMHQLLARVITVEVATAQLNQRLIPGPKPDISTTPQLPNACELRVANGTPILVMPNGEILPNQLDLSLDHPFEGGKKHLVKATVSMLVNLEDSMWLPTPSTSRPDPQALSQ
jgi:hypothetical protein